ncbi:20501_t:CDS:2 [Cetraspora pellucida]|uniref:20501_t:CDS:1 n=1 Tax=Cetraspora pellucida TaxID=1433469 RepID=A0A9N9HY54_9GLOM|nr:20501_t:CDS:2 [Cetraspora pellucida]
MSRSVLGSKQNQNIFHAAFLDGIRGVAALCVIYEHSQRFYNQSLPFTTFNYVGYLGVRCFFVLSAFLLTFRSMMDWERYYENTEKYIDTNSKSKNDLESKIDLEADLTDVPLLSKTDCNNLVILFFILKDAYGTNISSTKTKYNIFYKILFYVQLKIPIKHQIAIKLWLKFFLRRFMRVYPPYAILLTIIAYNDFVRRAYHERINPSNLVPHLLLEEAKFIFWTIPTEMKILGMPRTKYERYEVKLENNFGGFLYAILILVGLLSRDSSFVNACSSNFLRFCGQISFSIYLLHPIALTFVNEYLTWIGISAAEKEPDKREKVNNMLDAVMISYLLTIILSWLYHILVEKPSMNLANYIAKRWLNDVKLAKPVQKIINRE